MAKKTTGVVRWYDGSKDVFVHYTDITVEGILMLSEGEEVIFFLEETFRGPQATDVTRAN